MNLTFTLTVVAVAIVGLAAMILGARRSEAAVRIDDEEVSDWTMMTWSGESGKLVLQSRDCPPRDARARYSVAIVIEWRYGPRGLPDQSTMEAVYRFEDALADLRNRHVGIHMHTLMGNGIREWCYYAPAYPAFVSSFNKAVAGLPKMPIEISYLADPAWDYWRKLRSNEQGARS